MIGAEELVRINDDRVTRTTWLALYYVQFHAGAAIAIACLSLLRSAETSTRNIRDYIVRRGVKWEQRDTRRDVKLKH